MSFNASRIMKLTALLLTIAPVAPATLALGASTALVATAATGIALASIALGDYGKTPVTYDRTVAQRRERHPLAA